MSRATHRATLTRWINYCYNLRNKLECIVKRTKPDVIIYFQGFLPEDALLREIALSRGTPFLALERSAFNQKLVWDSISGLAVTRNSARNYFWRHERCISESTAVDYAADYMAGIATNKQLEHRSPPTPLIFERSNREQLKILFIAQVFTDSSVIFGQKADLSPLKIIETVAAFTKAGDHQLIIKLHPKELDGMSPLETAYESLTLRRMNAHPWADPTCIEDARIKIDRENRWDTFQLIHNVDLVVTQSSQAGLEAAICGKPVILCGEAFYRDLGFTIDVRDSNDLARTLQDYHPSNFDSSLIKAKAAPFFFAVNNHYCIDRAENVLFQLLANIRH